MALLSYKNLETLKEKNPGKTIIFCSGTFDLTHAGHVLFLEDCKSLGDILVVAVGPDKDISQNKGPGRPILNEAARLKIIDSLKPVDYSFVSNPTVPGAHWLSPIEEILRLLHPDIWSVNNDGGEMEYRKQLAATNGIKLVVLDRVAAPEFEGISSTAIIGKIKKIEK